MATPSAHYMTLIGGMDDNNSTIFTDGGGGQNLIKVGDNIKISGTASNNGVFTVTAITNDGTDVYYVLKGRSVVDESSTGVDIWSNNATTDYVGVSPASANGWTASAISPTIDGNDAQYIYHFADEALRVCNVNENNSSLIKWYGYIQRHQFSHANGLIFSEWQEHPNALNPPKSSGNFSYAYGSTAHAGGTATSYYKNNRGVTFLKKDGVSNLRVDGNPSTTTTAFTFENTSNTDVLDQSSVGEVISIGTALGTAPTEYLFCIKTSGSAGSTMTYSRSYGGNLGGSAPVDYADHEYAHSESRDGV